MPILFFSYFILKEQKKIIENFILAALSEYFVSGIAGDSGAGDSLVQSADSRG